MKTVTWDGDGGKTEAQAPTRHQFKPTSTVLTAEAAADLL